MGLLNKTINSFHKGADEGKKRLIFICTAIFIILLIISVIISMRGSLREKVPEMSRFNLAIPAEELFLPDKPDFLPDVLLERERRSKWTEQDAEEFWQDPMRAGEEQWRNKIEAVIDEFLERVP